MSLIKCPECSKEISDQAQTCPNCGYPIQISIIDTKEKFIKSMTQGITCCDCGSTDIVGVESAGGKLIIACNDCWKIQKELDFPEHLRFESEQNTTKSVECPYCHSTNTKKISGTSRAVSLLTFGFASKKVGKQWHCNKCGSDF